MIISNFHLKNITIVPFEANSPWVVDSYTVLPKPVSLEFLQSVGWWNPEIIQAYSTI